jgi:hypothetical protein
MISSARRDAINAYAHPSQCNSRESWYLGEIRDDNQCLKEVESDSTMAAELRIWPGLQLDRIGAQRGCCATNAQLLCESRLDLGTSGS